MIVGSGGVFHTVTIISERGCSVGFQSDDIAREERVGRVNVDAIAAVVGNHVVRDRDRRCELGQCTGVDQNAVALESVDVNILNRAGVGGGIRRAIPRCGLVKGQFKSRIGSGGDQGSIDLNLLEG